MTKGKNDSNDNKLIINMVKTDTLCFISDCMATDGYNYTYHHTKLGNLYFDGKKAIQTFSPNWLQIKNYPTKIQEIQSQPSINKRYEIDDESLISEKLPKIIKYEDKNNFSTTVIDSLYTLKYDEQPSKLKDVDYEIKIIMEVENFELPPVIDYKAFRKWGYDTKQMNITNQDISHQLFDKMIFPEVMLHTRPCSISSQNLYCLVRQHIKDNIDNKVAKITSDYDFCFTVKKIIPLIEPKTVTYHNIFARIKKERNKIQYSTQSFKEVEIFEMTHDQSKYNNYTVIKPIFADSEIELKNKIDEFLKHLIDIINQSLEMCPHCNGTGYVTEVKKFKQE